MRKIIKRKINISTHKRDLIDFINDEFYSHDKHNAFIEFTMKSLPTDNIIALFYFQKTKRYVETKAFVDGDKFTIEFDTSLINTDETVLGFIYFEKVAQSADVHRFSFGVKVSEIDKLHDIPIEEAKTKRVVAIEDIVTKAELDELFKRIEKNGGTYNDTEIRSSISSIEERVQTLETKPDKDTVYDDSDVKNRLSTLESNSSRYLTEHQSLADYALKSELYNDSALSERVTRLEQKPTVDTRGFATREELEAVRNTQPQIDKTDLVTKEELEAKGYLTAHQNLEEYAKKSEIPERYNDASLVERVTSLESKAIANGSYDDKPLLEKIHAIEEQFRNASNLYLTSHQSLEHLVTKQELESKGYLTQHQDISGLVTRDELASKNYLTEHQSLASLVTRDELEQKGYLTNHQDLSEYAKKTELYNDTALKERVSALENKAPVDLSNLVTHEELNGKHYLTEHQPLTDYALKSEIPQAYNDADLKERVTSLEAKALANGAYDDSNLRTRIHALETKEDKDTVYDDADLKRRLSALESKPDVQVDTLVTKQELESKGYLTNHQDLSEYAKKIELPTPYNDTALSERVAKLENKEDKDTIYNDAEIKQRLTSLEGRPQIDVSTLVSKEELASKNYLTNHQDVSGLVTKSELEQKNYLTQHQSLAEYALKSELYNDADIKQRLSTLETNYVTKEELHEATELDETKIVSHEELEAKHYLTTHQSLEHLVTKQELDSKGYLTSHQPLTDYATKSELNTLKQDVVTHTELVNRHYLTEHQSLELYAKKSELPTPYNDSALISRIGALENRPIVNPANLVTRDELEQKGYLTAHQSLANYALKSEIPQPYNDIQLVNRIRLLEQKPLAENGHSLNATVRIEGSYKNNATSQLNLFADVFYDDEVVTSGYTLDYYYRGFGNNNWQVLRNQTADSAGKFGTWSASQRSGGFFEVKIVVSYRGLKASAFYRLDNVNDGARGADGARGQQGIQGPPGPVGRNGANGRDGQPGQNIINQQDGQPMKYWCGTEAQFNRIIPHDDNTIYDILK